MSDSFFPLAIIGSALFALVALIFLIGRTLSFGKKPLYSRPLGKGISGVFYAFGKGMLPWEKESVAGYPITFIAGLIYHLAIFSALVILFLQLTLLSLPDSLAIILQILIIAGFLGGIGLLAKRAFSKKMIAISTPDDFFSNLLVDLFLLTVFWSSFSQSVNLVHFVATIALFLYIPMGKIRHCFFFFYARILMGLGFGRRGVFPRRALEI